MANFPINGSPEYLSMLNFWEMSNRFGSLAKNCRYAVVIRPQGEYITQYAPLTSELVYLCEAAEFPGRALLNVDVRYYGPNQKLPFQSVYEDINLTFLCRTESLEKQFFDDWLETINPTNSFDFNYRDEYSSQIDVYQYSEEGMPGDAPIPKYNVTLYNAYPILVNPQPLLWADDTFQRLVVTFTYTHWTRRNHDEDERTATGGRSYSLVSGSSPVIR